MRVAFYPHINKLIANPYWNILQHGLAANDCWVVDGGNGGRHWLMANRGKVDVLHYHFIQSFYAYENSQARLRWVLRFIANITLARAWGYRTVFTLHDLRPTWPLIPSWVDQLGHWAAVNLSTRVIIHCERARSLIRQVYGRHSGIRVVNHANFCSYYPNTMEPRMAREKLSIPDNHKVFAFVGGIRPNKGLDIFLESIKKLENRNITILIAGRPWPPEGYIKSLEAKTRNDPRVRLDLRHIADDELQMYFNAADCVVLPFREILTSSSTLLAMSFGRGVIVPDVGCLGELVKPHCGILYDPVQDDGLLQALTQALEVDWTAIGRAAFERVQPFTPERMAQETMSAYQ